MATIGSDRKGSKKTVKKPVSPAQAEAQLNIVGNVEYIRDMAGEGLRYRRDILVWLPPSYHTEPHRRFPVLYLHDGQNIMDPRTAYVGVDWQVDEWADYLMRTGAMEEAIIIGINNTPDRLYEYSDCQTGFFYRRFLAYILKPIIDASYRTKTLPEDTIVMGSSMGGLCSLLTVWKHSDVFGKAGCLSSSFYFNNDKSFKMVLFADEKPNGTFYIDSGEDGKRDAQKMFSLLSQKGYIIGEDIDYFYDRGAQHTESAWANRLARPLAFLLPRK